LLAHEFNTSTVVFRSFNSVTHLFTVMTISRVLCSGVCFISGPSFFAWSFWPRLTILISDLIAPPSQTVSDIPNWTTEDIGQRKISETRLMVLRVVAICAKFLLIILGWMFQSLRHCFLRNSKRGELRRNMEAVLKWIMVRWELTI
jgi:hypothetical protein